MVSPFVLESVVNGDVSELIRRGNPRDCYLWTEKGQGKYTPSLGIKAGIIVNYWESKLDSSLVETLGPL